MWIGSSGCGPDPMTQAKTALSQAGYTEISVTKPTGGYDELQFEAAKDGKMCQGRIVVLRGTVDIQGRCSDPAAAKAEEEAAAKTPLGKAQRACDKGRSKGCFEYGRLLVEGPPSQRDLPKAREVHERNCETRKHLDSCALLGQLYARAIGGPRDEAKALSILETACAKGNARSCAYQGRLAFVDQKYGRARKLFKKACRAGSNAGCNGLGTLFKQGKGGKEDMKQARKLFDRSCDAGYQEACSNLGVMLVKGQGGRPSPEAGRALLRKACKADIGAACHQLKKLGIP